MFPDVKQVDVSLVFLSLSTFSDHTNTHWKRKRMFNRTYKTPKVLLCVPSLDSPQTAKSQIRLDNSRGKGKTYYCVRPFERPGTP